MNYFAATVIDLPEFRTKTQEDLVNLLFGLEKQL